MTVNSAIELIQEKRNFLISLISQITSHDSADHDKIDKEILQHELKIAEMWKQDLEEILDELLSE